MAKDRATKARELEELLDPRVVRELALAVPGFDREGLLSAIIEAWGGTGALANSIVAEFRAAKPGSMVRQRSVELVCRLVSQHSDVAKPASPEQLSDEELHRQLAAVLPELKAQVEHRDAAAAG